MTYDEYNRTIDAKALLEHIGMVPDRKDQHYCKSWPIYTHPNSGGSFLLYPRKFVKKEESPQRVSPNSGNKENVAQEESSGVTFHCIKDKTTDKIYKPVSFIIAHYDEFPEYRHGMNPYHLANIVCEKLITGKTEQNTRQTNIERSHDRPFDISDYELIRLDTENWENRKPFYSYFKNRGIDMRTAISFAPEILLSRKDLSTDYKGMSEDQLKAEQEKNIENLMRFNEEKYPAIHAQVVGLIPDFKAQAKEKYHIRPDVTLYSPRQRFCLQLEALAQLKSTGTSVKEASEWNRMWRDFMAVENRLNEMGKRTLITKDYKAEITDLTASRQRAPKVYGQSNLSFPMYLPGDGTNKIVGFETRGCVDPTGHCTYKGMATGSNHAQGICMAMPGNTTHQIEYASVKDVYWFESMFDAMAYYELNKEHTDFKNALFVSTSGHPSEAGTSSLITITPHAMHHACFDNDDLDTEKFYKEDFASGRTVWNSDERRDLYFKLKDSIIPGITSGQVDKSGLPPEAYDLLPAGHQFVLNIKAKLTEVTSQQGLDPYFVREIPSPGFKDWNDELMTQKGIGGRKPVLETVETQTQQFKR